MIPEAVQGTYKITALTDKGEKVSHSFEIKEYGELLILSNLVLKSSFIFDFFSHIGNFLFHYILFLFCFSFAKV